MFYVTVGAEELSVDISNWWLSVIHCLLNVAIAIRLFLAVYPFHRLISWNYDHSGTMTFTFTRHFLLRFVSWFLARDPFLRTNRRAIVMMFVRLSVCLSVCLYGTGVHCDHKLHFSADLSLWLDSPMFWHPGTKACPPTPVVFFQFHLEERWGMDKCKLKTKNSPNS